MSAQKDDGEAGHRRGSESLESDDVGRKGNVLRAMAEEMVLQEIVYQ